MSAVSSTNFPVHIEKPTLVVDREKVYKNIQKIADKAYKSGVRFRPHFKTHQSADIGAWFQEFGVKEITVSSVDMAQYFAENGWTDISIAFPVNFLQIDKINTLARDVTLNLLVESQDAADFLNEHIEHPVSVWINIDTGQHKAGIDWSRIDTIVEVARHVGNANNCTLKGILTHAGHSYDERTKKGIESVYHEAVNNMNSIRDQLHSHGFENLEISYGDTPCCSVVDEFTGIDEIRPGNFVFYDLVQLRIGSCTDNELALAVACPVVAKYDESSEIVTYGGAVHLSKDFIQNENGEMRFGRIALWHQEGWGSLLRNAYVKKIYQEHGLIVVDRKTFNNISIGDVIFIVPVHVCLTVNQLRRYVTTDGEKLKAGTY